MAKVVLQNLAKSRRDAESPALQNLSLECADRELTVLLGPPDGGKSTLLRVIAGLDSVDSGDIFLGEQSVRALPPHKRDIALVAAEIPLLPHLTVAANITLPLALKRTSKDTVSRRLKEASEHLGLSAMLERKPRELNETDRVRVALARALALQPKAILLDDPLSALDPAARRHLRVELARLHLQFRATIILATTDASEAFTLGTRVAVVRHGEIEQVGSPVEIHRAPANLFVASVLGMSFLRGTIKASGAGAIFKESDGGIVELPLNGRELPPECLGRDVLLGVRAEDCAVVPAEKPNAQGVFQALVDFVELREGAALYHAQTGAHALLCRAPDLPDPREAGRRVRFQIDAARVHFFDPSTTRRIA
jgi:multiple sugar transport system ATP-binding protein